MSLLFNNLGDNTRTDSLAAFADSETVLIVHSYWSEQFNLEGYLIARHYDFLISRKFNLTSNVSCTEVELRFVTLGEWSMAATFLFL